MAGCRTTVRDSAGHRTALCNLATTFNDRDLRRQPARVYHASALLEKVGGDWSGSRGTIKERFDGGATVRKQLKRWSVAFKVRDDIQAGVVAAKNYQPTSP